jgi:hypothetical protein
MVPIIAMEKKTAESIKTSFQLVGTNNSARSALRIIA